MRETLRSISSLAESVLWLDGGQRQARRNAWAAMVTDAQRARERVDAAAAVAQATTVTPGTRTADRTVSRAR
jgi:hypothetical protein